MITPVISSGPRWLARLRDHLPERYRESFYRSASVVMSLLLGLGATSADRVFLWWQMGVAVVTSLLAMLYATSYWRVAMYTVVGPLGALLMAYGIVNDARWALVTAAVGQLFGITTSAAKTAQHWPGDYVLFSAKKASAPAEDPG